MPARRPDVRSSRWQAVTVFTVLLGMAAVVVGVIAARGAQSYYSWDGGTPAASAERPVGGAFRESRSPRPWPTASGPAVVGTPSPPAPMTSAPPPTGGPDTATASAPVTPSGRQVAASPRASAGDAPQAQGGALPPAAAPAPPPAAPAATTPPAAVAGTSAFVHGATGLCLDSDGTTYIHALRCNGSAYQQWTVRGLGPVVITHRPTGVCLDSNENGAVYAIDCNGGAYQKWTMAANGDGSLSLVDVATGMCMQSNGSGALTTTGCDGGAYQRWRRG